MVKRAITIIALILAVMLVGFSPIKADDCESRCWNEAESYIIWCYEQTGNSVYCTQTGHTLYCNCRSEGGCAGGGCQ